MTDDLTHTVTVTVTGNYAHGPKQHATVMMAGAGDVEHMLDAFRAAMVAAGFSTALAAKLDIAQS